MRPNGLLWIALSALLCWLGGDALVDSIRHSGPYAELYILFGGTVVAFGLVAMSFAFKQRVRINAMAEHMGRRSRHSRTLTFKTSKVAATGPAMSKKSSSPKDRQGITPEMRDETDTVFGRAAWAKSESISGAS